MTRPQCNIEDLKCSEYVEWLLCTNISVSIVTTLYVTCLVVLLKFSKTATFNKLTLMPYYFIMGSSIFKMFQYLLTYSEFANLTLIVNTIGSCCLVIAVFVQIFEWFNTWLSIKFQDAQDITTVVVDRHKFQSKEKKVWCLLKGLCALFIGATNAIVIITTILFPKEHELGNELKGQILLVAWYINASFFLITMALFPYAGYKKHHSAFLDYRSKLFVQATGTLNLIWLGIYLNFMIKGYAKPFISPEYLAY